MKHTIRIQPTAGGYSTLEFTHREEAASAFETLERIGFDGTLELHLSADTTTGTNRGICDRCGKERGIYPNTAGERICLGCWDEHDATPINDPRDTNLETDCAPTYSVQCFSVTSGVKNPLNQSAKDLEDALAWIVRMHEFNQQHPDAPAAYSGPYLILETRIIYSEN